MASQGDIRAARILLALALTGAIARWMATPGEPPGAIGYSAQDVSRPKREEVLGRSETLSEPLLPGERVNIDVADALELVRLPGIGPALAARIVDFRSQNGPFGGPDALLGVPGIGRATLRRLEPMLSFSESTRNTRASSPGLVSLNTASEAQLIHLPGIGPQKAAA
ncbi:MAG: helix-hairpin-helix domain-containing protein, partial [Gemmatimonadota bacterium]|nr:helix-hairpin-helix domain-containing protein [Gemmatimonadota bacterium]